MSVTVYRAAPELDAEYFYMVNTVVQEEPANEYNKATLGMTAYIGIENGKSFTPDAHTVQILERAAKDVQEYLIKPSWMKRTKFHASS